jgi:hypothetical protein
LKARPANPRDEVDEVIISVSLLMVTLPTIKRTIESIIYYSLRPVKRVDMGAALLKFFKV